MCRWLFPEAARWARSASASRAARRAPSPPVPRPLSGECASTKNIRLERKHALQRPSAKKHASVAMSSSRRRSKTTRFSEGNRTTKTRVYTPQRKRALFYVALGIVYIVCTKRQPSKTGSSRETHAPHQGTRRSQCPRPLHIEINN